MPNTQKEQLIKLLDFHLPRWEELPDFDLYMDQLIVLVKRYLADLRIDDNIITPSMVNNYVKLNLMPKPIKKKYQKIHLAYVICISLLKNIFSINDISDGILLQTKVSGLKGAYNMFCDEQEEAIHKTVAIILKKEDINLEIANFKSENAAIKLATLSLAAKLISKLVLEYKKIELL